MYTPIDMKRSMKFGSEYWEVFSPKVNRITKFFSNLEYDHWVLVVTNPHIKTFCEQPLRIKQKVNGKFVVSIIDMWVLYEDDAECFIEVKYANDAVNDERSKTAIGAQKLWCQENGFLHCLMTEKEIRKNKIYLDNMKTILFQIKNENQPTINEIDRIILQLKNSKLKVKELLILLPGISIYQLKEILAWLLYLDVINANIDEAYFNNNTEVWVTDHE